MDEIEILLGSFSILISILIGVILGYLHTINEKISEIKTTLAEIKVTLQLIFLAQS